MIFGASFMKNLKQKTEIKVKDISKEKSKEDTSPYMYVFDL